jgi:uncharacterized membrane protein
MWWKLVGLVVLTAGLVFAVIPIRTHAVVYDPTNKPPSDRVFIGDILGNMYLTPGAALLILFILAVASFLAFKVARRNW